MNPRVKKFFSYYRPYKWLFAADIACAMVVSAITLILPLCAGYITRHVLETNNPDALTEVYRIGALMLVLVAVHMLCLFFIDYQGHTMGALMESDMRTELFQHYQSLSFRFYDDHKTGQLMSRITSDLFWLSELFHHGPEDLVIAMLKLTGVFVICLFINVPLTLVVFVFIPVMLVYAFYFHHKMRIAATKSKERIADINAQVEDTLAGIRVVKSFANADVERRKFAHANHRFVDSRKDNYRSSAYLYAGVIAFTQLITVTVIVAGGTAIDRQALDPAELVTFLLYVGTLIDPIRQLTNFATLYQEGITGFNRFVDILAVEPEIVDAPDAIDLPTVREGISFHNVTFRYRNDMPHVLENISLEVAHGEFVALVGPSGAGKTTLCSLIPRFYDVTGGAILVDGHDVRDVTLHSLRRNIGLVHQDVYLFAGTIAENIRYGKLDATDDEIIAAAKQANAHEFIMGLPDGYDTDIGQRGVRLSGGQKQRLSIARVFLKNPPVLIFDEATSSLDNESEKAVQQSLERLAHDRTTLVIAHRLSTIRNAQRIVVLTEDGIVEQGSHSDLLSVEGVYARLYNTHVESSDIFAGSGRIEEVNHAGQIYSSTVEDR